MAVSNVKGFLKYTDSNKIEFSIVLKHITTVSFEDSDPKKTTIYTTDGRSYMINSYTSDLYENILQMIYCNDKK